MLGRFIVVVVFCVSLIAPLDAMLFVLLIDL